MRVCVISFKQCWQDQAGNWVSSGGFPAQMDAIGSLFDEMTLVILKGRPMGKGMPLPKHAQIVPLRLPTGADTRRKISVLAHLPYYLGMIARHVRQADVVHAPLPGDIPILGMVVAQVMHKKLVGLYNRSWI